MNYLYDLNDVVVFSSTQCTCICPSQLNGFALFRLRLFIRSCVPSYSSYLRISSPLDFLGSKYVVFSGSVAVVLCPVVYKNTRNMKKTMMDEDVVMP